MEVMDKPLLAYSLETFQQSEVIDDIILVVGAGQEDFCREKIVEAYGIEKVSAIVQGGSERYESVWNGLKLLKPEGYTFIHDGARPFVTEEIIQRAYRDVQQYHACVVGMPVKDTIKVVDADGMSEHTPDRSTLWLIQTPQVFETRLIQDAYAKLMSLNCIQVTDDAMVAEQMLGTRIKMTEGSYENIKITTPEDMEIAEVFARKNL
jgi:2-C-methyl-D-erythritol 4-phosphate cytidylyltransferase